MHAVFFSRFLSTLGHRCYFCIYDEARATLTLTAKLTARGRARACARRFSACVGRRAYGTASVLTHAHRAALGVVEGGDRARHRGTRDLVAHDLGLLPRNTIHNLL